MPELPEVETLKLGLQRYIVGKTISDVDVRDRKIVSGDETVLTSASITKVRRLAKGIIIDLNNGYSVAFHIKLTGQLIYRDEKTKDLPVMKPTPSVVPNKFTRVVFKLSDRSIHPHPNPLPRGEGTERSSKNEDSFLYFQEVRGFAWMKIVKTDDVLELPFFKSLGPEPIPSDSVHAALTQEQFNAIVQKSNIPIKALLMDQTKIGGIGNIYANDSCFDAKIDPRRKAKTMRSSEIKTLYDSLLAVLKQAFKYRGSSELNFVDVLGQMGEYQKHFLVYGQKGKPCRRDDGGIVQRIDIAGRGTFFCEVCQK